MNDIENRIHNALNCMEGCLDRSARGLNTRQPLHLCIIPQALCATLRKSRLSPLLYLGVFPTFGSVLYLGDVSVSSCFTPHFVRAVGAIVSAAVRVPPEALAPACTVDRFQYEHTHNQSCHCSDYL
jgi:hypothetical protein